MAINYNRGMSQRGEFVTPRLATDLLRRHVNPLVRVTDVRKLYGGSINRVLEFVLDREPGSLVAKIHDRGAGDSFVAELDSLRFFRDKTHFPVPEPLACIDEDDGFDGSMLIMQKIRGTTLESAELSDRGKHVFQAELGAAVAELHRHTAERFGPATSEQTHDCWLEIFGPTARRTIQETRGALPSSAREVLDHVADHLHHWLGHKPRPTLIHGDLWANNILLDDAHPDQPRILAFIDGLASYADPEYELAYLQLFGTAGKAFFDVYGRVHKIDPGYRRRCRVYWLITMLQNTKRFGEQYVPWCEKIAKELRQFAR
jgi:fructosamine-3-kinase